MCAKRLDAEIGDIWHDDALKIYAEGMGYHKTVKGYGTQGIDYQFLALDVMNTNNQRGRKRERLLLTVNFAKELCMIVRTPKAREIRQYLIGLSDQKDNLELITVKEAAFAVKVINCLKFIDNQKEAYSMHQKAFFDKNVDILNPKYIYAEFAQYRSKIVGWDKKQIDEAISEYITNHVGYNKSKVDKYNMSTKLSIIDIGEAIRVAVLDILYSKETDIHLANKFSILCKNLAKEMKIEPEKENKPNLFKAKEDIDSIDRLSLL